MNPRVLRVHPDVLQVDVPMATSYYDEIDRALGDRLTQLIVDALHQIEAHPQIFAEYLPGFRRVVLVPALGVQQGFEVRRHPSTAATE